MAQIFVHNASGRSSLSSSLAWRGLQLGPMLPLHFATNTAARVRRRDVVLHRHEGTIHPRIEGGVAVLGPDRTFVDCGTLLGLVALVAAGDWLVSSGFTSVAVLRAFAEASHLDGVQRARVAANLVRAGSESVRESMTRVELVIRGLPKPDVNADILDERGQFLARGDLVYWKWRVLVEYDGWYHERGARQRQHDLLRRERLEAAGWLVVVLTSDDLKQPTRMAWRVHAALVTRGYVGPGPRLDPRFGPWMRPNHA